MELNDIARQIDAMGERLSQSQKSQLSQLASDISQLRQEMSRQVSQNQGGNMGVGQSLERAGYNLSVSVNSFGEKLKLAFLWGCGILGVSSALIITLFWLILRDVQ